MIWYYVWYHMIWYDMIWYDMIVLKLNSGLCLVSWLLRTEATNPPVYQRLCHQSDSHRGKDKNWKRYENYVSKFVKNHLQNLRLSLTR